jgi:hypothetical protein
MRHVVVCVLAPCLALSSPSVARAEPWFGWGENAAEDQFVDGDFDEEDHVALSLGGRAGVTDIHGESWVSLVGFSRQLATGKNDLGGILVVGLAFDRFAAGSVHRLADPPRNATSPAPAPPPVPPGAVAQSQAVLPLAPKLARECVAAAWRASGLGSDDERIDSIVARSRTSALLPDARIRAMRLLTDTARTTTLATTDGTNYYDALGANLVLELRLTWRLDRLVFAGDEPTLERVRLERQEARSHLATRTLEVLFAWQRAAIALGQAVAGSHEQLEAQLRIGEAEATLDVLTGGWFSARDSP